MKKILLSTLTFLALSLTQSHAQVALKMTVTTDEKQTITGFGAASLENLMRPTQDAAIITKAYNPLGKIGLNILRMEMSPTMVPDIKDGWDTPYDWAGQVTDVKAARRFGAIVFATPWSPAPELKTNNSASGGNDESKPESERVRATLKYPEKLFPWFNQFAKYMKSQAAAVQYVSFQNEPDWWVNYSGCLYDPQQMYDVIKNNMDQLDKKGLNIKFIAGEPLGFNTDYFHRLLNDPEVNAFCDVLAGHVYGDYGCKKNIATLRSWAPDKEIWMTEHSVASGWRHIPSWSEDMEFVQDVNECLINGCNAYIYWYLCKDFGFIYDGDKYDQSDCPGSEGLKRGDILPKGYLMGQFAKNLKGATMLRFTKNFADDKNTPGVNPRFELNAFKKDNKIIVNALDTMSSSKDLEITLPYTATAVKRITSSEGKLCAEDTPVITEGKVHKFTIPARSFVTLIFTVEDPTNTEAVEVEEHEKIELSDEYYNAAGQRINKPTKGFFINNGRKYLR